MNELRFLQPLPVCQSAVNRVCATLPPLTAVQSGHSRLQLFRRILDLLSAAAHKRRCWRALDILEVFPKVPPQAFDRRPEDLRSQPSMTSCLRLPSARSFDGIFRSLGNPGIALVGLQPPVLQSSASLLLFDYSGLPLTDKLEQLLIEKLFLVGKISQRIFCLSRSRGD